MTGAACQKGLAPSDTSKSSPTTYAFCHGQYKKRG